MASFCGLTVGPLAQDPYAIVEIMRSIWSDKFMSNQDAMAVPVDFREELYKEGRTFRIGFYTSDEYVDPLPGNQRVIREAAEMLKARGHELVPFSLGDIVHETSKGVFGTVYADGGARSTEILKDEPLADFMEPLRGFLSMHSYTKKILGWFYHIRGDYSMADFFLSYSAKAIDVQVGIDRIFASRKRLVQKMKEERIDVLLCPTTLSPALPHAIPNKIPFTALMPTILWNAMDFPAGVVTTGFWTDADESALAEYPETGCIQKTIKEGCKHSVGLPLSVQIVAPAYRDEMVMRVMADLYEAVKEKGIVN